MLIQKPTIDASLTSMIGAPVIIQHQDITEKNADELRCGAISDAYFNDMDGWYYCEGVIWDKKAQKLIDKGWSVSCSYDFLGYNDEGGVENNIKYDKEFTKLNFTHLAIVDNPRYERANIVFNSKNSDGENGRWVTIKGTHIFIPDGKSLDDVMEAKGWTKGHKDFSKTMGQLKDLADKHNGVGKEDSKKSNTQTKTDKKTGGISDDVHSIIERFDTNFGDELDDEQKDYLDAIIDAKNRGDNDELQSLVERFGLNFGDELNDEQKDYWDAVEKTVAKSTSDEAKENKQSDKTKKSSIKPMKYDDVLYGTKYHAAAKASLGDDSYGESHSGTQDVMKSAKKYGFEYDHRGNGSQNLYDEKTGMHALAGIGKAEDGNYVISYNLDVDDDNSDDAWRFIVAKDLDASFEHIKGEFDKKVAKKSKKESGPREIDMKTLDKKYQNLKGYGVSGEKTDKLAKKYGFEPEPHSYEGSYSHYDDKNDRVYYAMVEDAGDGNYILYYEKADISAYSGEEEQKVFEVSSPDEGFKHAQKLMKEAKSGKKSNKTNNEKEQDMAIIRELKKLIRRVENEKEEQKMDEKEKIDNENVDKRKLIDEVGGILKGKVDEEVWRTVIGKLEKLSYDKSEAGSADNKKVKNEDDDKEVEEVKEDVKEDVENKCKNSKLSFDKINEIYNSVKQVKSESKYVSRQDKLDSAVEYFK